MPWLRLQRGKHLHATFTRQTPLRDCVPGAEDNPDPTAQRPPSPVEGANSDTDKASQRQDLVSSVRRG